MPDGSGEKTSGLPQALAGAAAVAWSLWMGVPAFGLILIWLWISPSDLQEVLSWTMICLYVFVMLWLLPVWMLAKRTSHAGLVWLLSVLALAGSTVWMLFDPNRAAKVLEKVLL